MGYCPSCRRDGRQVWSTGTVRSHRIRAATDVAISLASVSSLHRINVGRWLVAYARRENRNLDLAPTLCGWLGGSRAASTCLDRQRSPSQIGRSSLQRDARTWGSPGCWIDARKRRQLLLRPGNDLLYRCDRALGSFPDVWRKDPTSAGLPGRIYRSGHSGIHHLETSQAIVGPGCHSFCGALGIDKSHGRVPPESGGVAEFGISDRSPGIAACAAFIEDAPVRALRILRQHQPCCSIQRQESPCRWDSLFS